MFRSLTIITLFLLSVFDASATETYQSPKDFIHGVFKGEVPEAGKLWIKEDLRQKIRGIMEHDLGVLRLRYWFKDERTAWILEEIGKERPITTGLVVSKGKLEQIRVLIFRESRGWEVRYPFFTDQFKGASLDDNNNLDKPIDGISGATLSVMAMKKLARLAIVLHNYVTAKTLTEEE